MYPSLLFPDCCTKEAALTYLLSTSETHNDLGSENCMRQVYMSVNMSVINSVANNKRNLED